MTMPSIDQSADLAARRAALAAAEPGLRVRDQAARLQARG